MKFVHDDIPSCKFLGTESRQRLQGLSSAMSKMIRNITYHMPINDHLPISGMPFINVSSFKTLPDFYL